MKRKEFLDLLRFYLSSLPKVVVDDIISDYYEHFDIGLKEGKSEEDISRDLGSPHDIAEEYLSNEQSKIKNYYKEKKSNKSEKKENNKKTNIFIIILAIIGGLVLLPFAGGIGVGIFGAIIGVIALIFGLIVALFAGSIGFFAAGIALLLSFLRIFPRYISIPVFLYTLSGPTRLFFSAALIFVSILVMIGAIALVKAIFKGIKNAFISIKWKINKKRSKK